MGTNDEPLSDPRDYVLDLSSARPPGDRGKPAEGSPATTNEAKLPHLSVLFECCNVYASVYRNAAGTAYAGHCPRCSKPVRIAIGAGGTTSRIFRAK